MLIRKKLTADEFSNPNLRYDDGCDCFQFTPDGGTTWIDQPSADPRSSTAYLLPPLTGTDTQCRAAEGMKELIRLFVDARLETISDIGLAGAILGVVGFLPGFNLLYLLILAFAGLAVAIAAEVLEAAFTAPVYEQIKCIFFCNMDENGQMSETQFADAYADLIELDTIARTWVQEVMNLVGAVGMSNAGVALEAASDCDECPECEEWCYQSIFENTLDVWSFVTGACSSGGSGGTVQPDYLQSAACFSSPVTYNWLIAHVTFDQRTVIAASTLFDYGRGDFSNFPPNGVDNVKIQFLLGGVVQHTEGYDNPSNINNVLMQWEGSVLCDEIKIRGLMCDRVTGSNNGYLRVKNFTITGLGENPIGADNCPE